MGSKYQALGHPPEASDPDSSFDHSLLEGLVNEDPQETNDSPEIFSSERSYFPLPSYWSAKTNPHSFVRKLGVTRKGFAVAAMAFAGCFLLVFFAFKGGAVTESDAGIRVSPYEGFDIYPTEDSLRENLRYITSKPHLAGKGKDLADWMARKFQSFGLETKVEVYYPYINFPRERRLAIHEPSEFAFEAKLREEVVGEEKDEVPTFHAYSASGNVTAEVVYANRGTLEDFEALDALGIGVRGKIVLVRNGGNFRGVKVRLAQIRGAAGVLTFSDPSADGFRRGPVYPAGPFRPGSGVERGSVHYVSLYPGDPLTPGIAATKDAPRLALKDVKNIPKIPSLPVSYDDASPLLRALEGHGRPASEVAKDWQGGLNLTYWTGPSLAKVNLVNAMEGGTAPIYNVIATIPGALEADREVLLGNHRDGWVFGAVDPGSGTAALLEMAKVFGRLLELGWRPRRTIRLCSWDGEEYGQLGSVEWAEDHASAIAERAVAYINVDKFEGNFLRARGTPALLSLVEQVAKLVVDPTAANATLFDSWRSSSDGPVRLGELGSGSDYTSFYEHLGVASLDLGFVRRSGIYHSRYDTFDYVERFGDPGFRMHRAMTKFWGKLALSLADSPILPFNTAHYCQEILRLSEETLPPSAQAGLRGVLDALVEAGASLQATAGSLECSAGDRACSLQMRATNDRLAFFERKLLDPDGIPSRPWYKHILFAPGLWAGYASQPFPAFQEALASGRPTGDIALRYQEIFQNATGFLLSQDLS